MLKKIYAGITYFFRRKNTAKTVKIAQQKTNKIRQTYKYQKFKKKVKLSFPQECWNCGSQEEIQIHHIISIKENCTLATDINNIVMLCKPCHVQFHKDCTDAIHKINKEKISGISGTLFDKDLSKLNRQRKKIKAHLKDIEAKIAKIEFERAKKLESEGFYSQALKSFSKAHSFSNSSKYLQALKSIQRTVNEIMLSNQ
jgi:5-methylcytosine-specific restriction endonuclease McrA